MKKIKKILFIILMLAAVQNCYPVQFVLTAQNITLTGNYITFDLYIRSTAAADTIFLASSSWGWLYNNALFTNPAFAVVEGFSTNLKSRTGVEVGELFYTLTANAPNGNKLTGDISGPDPQSQTTFNQRVARISNQASFHRIGRYKIAGITTYYGQLGLDWYTQYCTIWAYQTSSPFNTYQLTGTYSPIQSFSLPVIKISNVVPEKFDLRQNYPNPFNPLTKMEYDIPVTSGVNITVYDITGKLIEILVNKQQTAGTYSVTWDAGNYPSGVYLCRFNSEGFSAAVKMILLK